MAHFVPVKAHYQDGAGKHAVSHTSRVRRLVLYRCRANMASEYIYMIYIRCRANIYIRQWSPDSGLGCQVRVFKPVQVVPSSLGRGRSLTLGLQPRVKSLRSSYTGLYPVILHGVVSANSPVEDPAPPAPRSRGDALEGPPA